MLAFALPLPHARSRRSLRGAQRQRVLSRAARACSSAAEEEAPLSLSPSPSLLARDSPLACWQRTLTLRCGARLRIRPARLADLDPLVSLLSEEFAKSLQATGFTAYLSRQIFSYCAARLASPLEQAVLLQAELVDGTGSVDGAGASDGVVGTAAGALPRGLLGVCEVSLSPRTRTFTEKRCGGSWASAELPHTLYVLTLARLLSLSQPGAATARRVPVQHERAPRRAAPRRGRRAAGRSRGVHA